MKSDAADAVSFATLRIVGDQLAPDEITAILQTVPTCAYHKGEKVRFGPSSPESVGKTGVWLFSTDGIVSSPRIEDHLQYLIRMLLQQSGDTDRIALLHDLLRKKRLKAHVSVFWHGARKTRRPTIAPTIAGIFKALPADIETDFDSDDEPARRRVAMSSPQRAEGGDK